MRALLLLLALAGAALSQEYRPPPYVLYGHGAGGDGLGYGFRNGYMDQVTKAYSARPTPDSGPWGRYDNSVPGYRAHGMRFANDFYGRTPNDPEVHFVGSSPRRGRHNASLSYDRHGRPVYTIDE